MRVRDALVETGVTVEGIAAAVGTSAAASIVRDRLEPARRALAGRADAQALLIVMLHLGDSVSVRQVRAADLPLDDLVAAGLLAVEGDRVVPLLRIEPLEIGGAPAWVVADFRRTRPLPADHVLGLGGAASTLSGITMRDPVGRALDLGTGGGVQLLHLAGHARRLVGTDVSERALRLARMTLALNDVDADLRLGDRYAPVEPGGFDLIVANPPMVIGSGDRFTYRDGGLEGDAMSASVITESATYLAEGGRCQVLAHWLHRRDQDWRERVATWLPSQAHALVVQREVLDPAAYAEMWLADSGDVGTADFAARFDAWMRWFDERGVEAVGMGWVCLQRTDSAFGLVRLEDLRQPLEQPLGRAISATFDAWQWSAQTADLGVLDAVFAVADGVVMDQRAEARDGWVPGRPVLVQTRGLARSAPTDAFGAFVVGACEGRRPLRDVLSEAAAAFGHSPAEIAEGAVEAVRGLVEAGFLVPIEPESAAPEATLV